MGRRQAYAYRSHSERERMDAKRAAALDAFGRLLDLNREPARQDQATVEREFPGVAPRLRELLRLRLGATKWAAWLDAKATEERRTPELDAAPEPDWSEGATREQLARAFRCSPQNVSKAIERLRQKKKLDAGSEKKTRGVWAPEHAREIWKDLCQNARGRKS